MSFLSNPKVMYATRIAQLILGILFLVLICYDGTHRAWWRNINGPLAVGVISAIFTFAITIYSMYVPFQNRIITQPEMVQLLTRKSKQIHHPSLQPLLRWQHHHHHRPHRRRSPRLPPLGGLRGPDATTKGRLRKQAQTDLGYRSKISVLLERRMEGWEKVRRSTYCDVGYGNCAQFGGGVSFCLTLEADEDAELMYSQRLFHRDGRNGLDE